MSEIIIHQCDRCGKRIEKAIKIGVVRKYGLPFFIYRKFSIESEQELCSECLADLNRFLHGEKLEPQAKIIGVDECNG